MCIRDRFLEKPVCIDEAQYARLLAAPPALRGRVMVSFPLHVTCIVQEMKSLVDSLSLIHISLRRT